MKYDVVVVGGGVVGLSAALAMRQRGYSVALLDAGSLSVDSQAVSPRVYAINPASQRLLQALDVWRRLDTLRLSPYQRMHVWDAANQAHIDFDSRAMASDRLGTILDESNLRQALLAEMASRDIALYPNVRVTAVKVLSDSVEVSDGECVYRGRLLMVADGAHSPTRELLGVPMTQWSYHQQALVTTVHTEKPHQQTAYQIFNREGTLAFLPLTDPHQCSIVWSSAPKQTEHRMGLAEGAFNHALTQAFEAHLGMTTVLSLRHQFPLNMRHVKHYTGPHWLLMGDAAHTIHPLAGLGLNLGLADLTHWLLQLDAIKGDLGSKRTLGAYQRQRSHAVWRMIGLMEGLKALFLNPTPSIAALRGLGLSACHHLPPLKRIMMEHASAHP